MLTMVLGYFLKLTRVMLFLGEELNLFGNQCSITTVAYAGVLLVPGYKRIQSDMGNCYVNISANARWRSTIGLDSPWEHPPAYCRLVGFANLTIQMDLLHVGHLGVGRELRFCTLGKFCFFAK